MLLVCWFVYFAAAGARCGLVASVDRISTGASDIHSVGQQPGRSSMVAALQLRAGQAALQLLASQQQAGCSAPVASSRSAEGPIRVSSTSAAAQRWHSSRSAAGQQQVSSLPPCMHFMPSSMLHWYVAIEASPTAYIACFAGAIITDRLVSITFMDPHHKGSKTRDPTMEENQSAGINAKAISCLQFTGKCAEALSLYKERS